MFPDQHDVLIVASWYPSIADPVAGRFVADQAAAITSAGCRVAVASFDPAELFGSGAYRDRLALEVSATAERAVMAGAAADHASEARRPAFSRQGWAAPPIPVARLTVPGGQTRSVPILHAAHHRTVALRRLARFGWSDAGAGSGIPRPTVIHAHTGYPDGVAAAALAAELDVPLVITEHATFLDRQLAIPDIRAAYVAAGRQAVRLIAVSAVFADHLRSTLPEIADRVAVVPNAVDVEAFTLAADGERRAGELLFVGYLKEIKGIDVLLRALALVRARRPGVTLRLVGEAGDSILDARWRTLASELGVRDAVAFDPPLDRAGIAMAMRRADIFVHASRYETFGVVAAEALATGLPVVATESGGVPELLGESVNAVGAVVPKDDPEAFAAAVLRVLEGRAGYDGTVIRASIVGRVGGPAVADRLLRIYDEAAASRQRPRAAGAAAETPAPVASAPAKIVPAGPQLPAAPLVVVAFDYERAALLARLAPIERAAIVLVTSNAPTTDALAGFRLVVMADLHDRVRSLADTRLLGTRATGWRRLARAIRHPLAMARRRGLLPGLDTVILGAGTTAVRRAVVAAGEGVPGMVPTLAVADGIDALAARAILDEGLATAAPGGLRWAADQASSEPA